MLPNVSFCSQTPLHGESEKKCVVFVSLSLLWTDPNKRMDAQREARGSRGVNLLAETVGKSAALITHMDEGFELDTLHA